MANYSDRNVLFKDIDNGNVGIGTSGPTSILHLKSDAANDVNSGYLFEAAGNTDKLFRLYQESVAVDTRARMELYFADALTHVFDSGSDSYINTGSFGIGTTSPSEKLDINDNTAGKFTISAYNANATGDGIYTAIFSAASTETALEVQTNNTANTALIVRGDGHVGVGTASPDGPLHVSSTLGLIVGSGRYHANWDVNPVIQAGQLSFYGPGNANYIQTNSYFESSTWKSSSNVGHWQIEMDNNFPNEFFSINFEDPSAEGSTITWSPFFYINDSGNCGFGGETSPSYDIHTTNEIFTPGGILIGAELNDNWLDDSSHGGASATLYIGNQTINTTSDIRIKTDIIPTTLDSLSLINQINIYDYTWQDPSDKVNARNKRGVWTGLIAQELVEIIPTAVNAPRNPETNEVDFESNSTWLFDDAGIHGHYIKAIQQLTARIVELEKR